jgi:integrase/recombinase XerD
MRCWSVPGAAPAWYATCHELRHTCLTRLREAGMAFEAVQAQAGHASIESTRIYLHLADDWLASQYNKAAEVLDAQVFADHPITPPATTPAASTAGQGLR